MNIEGYALVERSRCVIGPRLTREYCRMMSRDRKPRDLTHISRDLTTSLKCHIYMKKWSLLISEKQDYENYVSFVHTHTHSYLFKALI